ncbi:FecCD family ABC transporter permease [Marinobacterium litorale]|uniref:FecCD family ABC transporter permease n=1 Tax=Marinobacterium litorale TaxID=404770 RepID=UPI0003F4B8F2|nr:iron ABC transporter permease [Marinobacterium litorale]
MLNVPEGVSPPFRHSPVLFRGAVILGLAVVCSVSLSVGVFDLSPSDWVDPQSDGGRVLYQLRLPHLLTALLVGALLGGTGAAAQGLFRNPLADPSLIGVSAGAALASVTLMVVAGAVLEPGVMKLLLPAAAFVGGLLVTVLVVRLSRTFSGISVTTLLLTGMAVNAIAGAGIGALKYLSDDVALRQASFWLLGNLTSQGWLPIIVLIVVGFPVLMLLCREGRELNLLLLGVSQAQLVGVDVQALQRRLVLLCALGVGCAVAFVGLVGFVGLIVPHLVRLLCGPDNRYLLPHSIIFGALFMALADLLSRVLISPAQLPVGILTALVGGPFFLLLLTRGRAFGGGRA